MKNKLTISYPLFLLGLIFCFISCTKDHVEIVSNAETLPSTLVKSIDEYHSLLAKNPDQLVNSHEELLIKIKKNELLHEYLYKDQKILIDFLNSVRFTKKGLTNIQFSLLEKHFPDASEKLTKELVIELGFDPDHFLDIFDNYGGCDRYGNCGNEGGLNCKIALCNPYLVPDYFLNLEEIIRSNYNYIQDFISPNNDLKDLTLPTRRSNEWFFKHFDLGKLNFEEKDLNWLQENIKKDQIMIFGNQVTHDGEPIQIASLIFTKNLDRPEIFKEVPGIIIDWRYELMCGYRFSGTFPNIGSCNCWLTFNCFPKLSAGCKWKCDFIEWKEIIPDLIYEIPDDPCWVCDDLDILKELSIDHIRIDQPIIDIERLIKFQ